MKKPPNHEIKFPKSADEQHLLNTQMQLRGLIAKVLQLAKDASDPIRDGREVTLVKARRIWRWAGAMSLSQLAQEGTKEPEECRFPCEVDRVVLLEAIEILDVTPEAQASIASVPVWSYEK